MEQKLNGKEMWSRLAKVYDSYRSPFRPCVEDLGFIAKKVESLDRGRPLQVLLLGVTPDIATMSWPENVSILAIDYSEEMIAAVWPGDVPGRRRAVCADWLECGRMNLACDIAVGDGVTTVAGYPDGLKAVGRAVASALRPDGVLLMRSFVQPPRRERPEDVLDEMIHGDQGTFSEYLFRLLMSLQPSTHTGIRRRDACRYWLSFSKDRGEALSRPAWMEQAQEITDRWRDSDVTFVFPTLDELRSQLCDSFVETAMAVPSYSLGERCPTISYARRNQDGRSDGGAIGR